MFARPHVRQGNADHLRVLAGIARQFHESSPCLKDRIVCRFVAVGPETCQAYPHNVRFDGLQGLVSYAELFIIPWKLVRGEDVNLQIDNQVFENVFPLGSTQVESDTLLPRVDGHEVGVHPFLAQSVLTYHAVGIPVHRVFEPYHFHAVHGQTITQVRKDGCLLQRQHCHFPEYIH
ncbi:MAG: hypothetical protein A4E61_00360 [Syntrophorhabdus sp. PtaB.Bin184]|nr:MAG: hypothetical protein A4E61_00360 [Syntrophorhabdus sp. PtaB.Bin184]